MSPPETDSTDKKQEPATKASPAAPAKPVAAAVAPPLRRSGRAFGEAWSGGQWSVVRVLFALYLVAHLARALELGGELASENHVVVGVGLLATLLFALGSVTRIAALVVLGAAAWLAWRTPFASPPRMLVLALPLLANLFAPAAPYGSRAARGRVDPDGGWRLPPNVYRLLWLGVAVSCAWSSATKLSQATWRDGGALAQTLAASGGVVELVRQWLLELPPWLLQGMTYAALGAGLAFAPLALLRATRPFAWVVLLACHVAALPISGWRDGHLLMVATLLYLFDPAWLAPWTSDCREFVYFDGHCGLCHRLVRFVLAEDRNGIFTFSPLQGQAVRGVLSEHARASLPDSVVLVDRDHATHVKSDAGLRIYDALGGVWRIAARLLGVIPRPLRDLGYDLVAATRHRLFKRPADACPLMPPTLKDRFVA